MSENRPPTTWLTRVSDEGLHLVAEEHWDGNGTAIRQVRLLFDNYRVRPTLTGHGADVTLNVREVDQLMLSLRHARHFLEMGVEPAQQLGWEKLQDGR